MSLQTLRSAGKISLSEIYLSSALFHDLRKGLSNMST